jgi:HAD superfamily hydrolase (TIGR01549 family)
MNLLFDLDDTILDEEEAKKYCLKNVYFEFKEMINYDENNFYSICHEIIPKYYKLYYDGELTYQQQREKCVIETFGNRNIPKLMITKVNEAFDLYYKQGWKPFEDSIDILVYFSNNFTLGLITNGSPIQQNEKIDTLKIRKYFDCIVIGGEEKYQKPDERIFLKACEKLKCKPSGCYFIGDSWELDVLGSNRCGMKSVWVNRYDRSVPNKIDNFFMIATLRELKLIIENKN